MRGNTWRRATALTFVTALALTAGMTLEARAQTLYVLYNFNHSGVGIIPQAGVTMDAGGNLYGTTSGSGANGYGAVYKLTPRGDGWTATPLYSFQGGNDGAEPEARVVFGPDGALYGTTTEGGGSGCNLHGCGTVFRLTPSATICHAVECLWTETVLYRFQGTMDGAVPGYGDLVFDQHGNLYGTTGSGAFGYGTVYELTNSGGNWSEATLYAFTGGTDGDYPVGGVVFGPGGDIFGTNNQGVFELVPAGGGWSLNTLLTFQYQAEGLGSQAGLIFDNAGNFYGDTEILGPGGGGTMFQGSPAGGSWNFQTLYAFERGNGAVGTAFIFDNAGNLYGARVATGSGYGEVFELMPGSGSWTHATLHQFEGGRNDGASPYGGVVRNSSGNLFGTTSAGGRYGYGIVYEITP